MENIFRVKVLIIFSYIKQFKKVLVMMPGFKVLTGLGLAIIFLLQPGYILAGESGSSSLNIGIGNYGISLGNSQRFNGIRMNFSDHSVEEVNGINITIWRARNNSQATIRGISVGVIAPQAGRLSGFMLGGIAVGADKCIAGISVAGIAIGSGDDLRGIQVAGLAVGSKNSLSGITFGGIGIGTGGNLTGIGLAGLGTGAHGNIYGLTAALIGVGSGKSISGITMAGVGAGASENIKGLTIAGIGAGAGRNIVGITAGGIGAGAGRNITGITIGGVGVGCGGELRGLTIAGVGVGAPVIEGVTIAGAVVNGKNIQGLTVTLGMMKVSDKGTFGGLSFAGCNWIKGKQSGLTVGLFNYSWLLDGVQIGLINYARNNPKFMRWLPFINWHFD